MVFSLSRSVSLAQEARGRRGRHPAVFAAEPGPRPTSTDCLMSARATPTKTIPRAVGVAVAVTASTGVQVADSDHARRPYRGGRRPGLCLQRQDPRRGPLELPANSLAWLTETEELVGVRPARQDDPPLQLRPTRTARSPGSRSWGVSGDCRHRHRHFRVAEEIPVNPRTAIACSPHSPCCAGLLADAAPRGEFPADRIPGGRLLISSRTCFGASPSRWKTAARRSA